MSEHDVKPGPEGQPTENQPENTQTTATPDQAVPEAAKAETDAEASPPEGEPPIPSMTKDAAETAEATSEDMPDTDPIARIQELETQAAEANDRALRALAEAENVRRRAERDKQDASKYAISTFARDVLSVGDNLRRALDSIDAEARKSSEAMETLATGVEMTERELQTVLERQGIKRIDPLGQRFDSNQHEALFEIPDESQPSGMVAQVIEAGYMLNDRLLRPAKVGITKGGPKPEPAAQQNADQATADGQSDGNKAYEKDGDPTGGKLDEQL